MHLAEMYHIYDLKIDEFNKRMREILEHEDELAKSRKLAEARDRAEAKPDIVCNIVKKCLKCERIFTGNIKLHKENEEDEDLIHVCGYSRCSNCRKYCDMNEHKCHMRMKMCKGGNCTGDKDCVDNIKKCYPCQTRTEKYMFYDFETTQETGTHVVNWVDCEDFKGDKYTFETIEEFCQFIFNKDNYSGYTFIAHNSKGYDAQFIRN